ncbi:MAG: lamin tail domain-containing protein [Patescibacteria group bacterium]
MFKKFILFSMGIFFFAFFHSAHADVVLNELMYYPNDGDTNWVEIYNNGSTDVLIKTGDAADAWRVSSGTTKYHLNGSDFTIKAGEYVILACNSETFLSKHSGFSGNVVDLTASGFSNTGTTIKLWDDSGDAISNLTYTTADGGNNDSNSLQLVSGSWVGATPTPGSANFSTNNSNNTDTNNDNNTDTNISTNSNSVNNNSTTNTVTKAKTNAAPTIKTKITAKTLSIAGLPVEFSASATGLSGETLFSGKYFWNFGDGDSKEINLNQNTKFTHAYFYPGDYSVYLEYYSNYYSDTSDATDKIIIKIVESDVIISSVGDDKDFFVELSNNSGYDADLSRWMLTSINKNFVFPKNTILPSKKKIIFSSHITNFTILDKDTLKLLNPNREVVFDYFSSLLPKMPEKKITNKVIYVSPAPEVSEQKIEKENKKEEQDLEVPAEDLSALAIKSVAEDNSYDIFFYLGLASFLFIAGSGVYFVRRWRRVPAIVDGNDFQILDE